MGNYNNREGGGNRFGGGGSRPHFGANRRGGSGGAPFPKKSWGDRGGRDDDRPVTFHKATCAECSRACDVPFRPTEGKPVYCKDCFANRGGGTGRDAGRDSRDRGGDRFPKRDFDTRSPSRPQFENNKGNDVVTKQLEAVNAKLERLIQAVDILASGSSAKKVEKTKEVTVFAPKKSSKKKVGKK